MGYISFLRKTYIHIYLKVCYRNCCHITKTKCRQI